MESTLETFYITKHGIKSTQDFFLRLANTSAFLLVLVYGKISIQNVYTSHMYLMDKVDLRLPEGKMNGQSRVAHYRSFWTTYADNYYYCSANVYFAYTSYSRGRVKKQLFHLFYFSKVYNLL